MTRRITRRVLRMAEVPSSKINPPTPPDVMVGVPRAVIRAVEPRHALHSALAALKNGGGFGPLIAFGILEDYFEAAKHQQRRIAHAKRALMKSCSTERIRPLFDEVHFYLICWVRIAKLGRFIAHVTRFRRTGLVLRRYHAELKERVDARDHLEHFEERLPGGSRRDKLAIPGDLLNMIGDFLTYGGQRIDIGPTSVRLLRALVMEFRTAVLFDSIESLAAADPDRAVSLLRRAGSARQLTWVMRQMRALPTSSRAEATARKGARRRLGEKRNPAQQGRT